MMKRILSIVLSLCMVLAYTPATAFAQTASTESKAVQPAAADAATTAATVAATSSSAVAGPAVVAIEIGGAGEQAGLPVDGAGALLAMGTGWAYDSSDGSITLDAGYAYTFTGAPCTCTIVNYGTIEGGVFEGAVVNAEDAAIEGGVFEEIIDNSYGGFIASGNAVSFGVVNDLDNLATDNGATAVASGSDYAETLSATEGYALPETVSVSLNGQEASQGEDYTWDAATGALVVFAAADDKLGPISIAASAAVAPAPASTSTQSSTSSQAGTTTTQTTTSQAGTTTQTTVPQAEAAGQAALSVQSDSVGQTALTPQGGAVTIDLSTCTYTLYLYPDGYKYNGTYTSYKGSYVLTGATSHEIVINNRKGTTPLNVTFKDAAITLGGTAIDANGDTNLTFEGTNTITTNFHDMTNYAAIYIGTGTLTINNTGNLTVSVTSSSGTAIGAGFKHSMGNIVVNGTDTSILTATAGTDGGAGIGCPGGDAANTVGSITINGGTVIATGGKYSPGIGANTGTKASSSTDYITITGGTITATGGDYAAGIGTGDTTGDPVTISIFGGTIAKAQGGYCAAGIGGGYKESGGVLLNIDKAAITEAVGGKYGAGIGSGEYSSGDLQIFLYNGSVGTATGGYEASGIGSGDSCDGSTHITCSNMSINGAQGGDYGAGIGGGYKGSATVVIHDACSIQASGGKGSAGIGGGSGGNGDVTIDGTGFCNATAGMYGAGIGGGDEGSGTVAITGSCIISAAGGYKGAGIGGGCDNIGNVTISAGEISATGGGYGSGIGDADDGHGGTVNISGGTVLAQAGDDYNGIGNYDGNNDSKVIITGGNIKAIANGSGKMAIGPKPTDGNGNTVYRTQLTVPMVEGVLYHDVSSIVYTQGGSTLSYNLKNVKTLDNDKIYAWLPEGSTNTASLVVHDDPYEYWLSSVNSGSDNIFTMNEKTNPTPEDFTFTVGSETRTGSADGSQRITVAYDGSEHAVTVDKAEGVTDMGAISVKYAGSAYTSGIPTEPGTYEIYAKNQGTKTYNSAETFLGYLVIEKASADQNPVSGSSFACIYDGQPHTISASAAKSGSTLYYSTVAPENATDRDWSTTSPAFWRAGTYTVYVKATNPEYQDSFGSVTLTISKRKVTITADSATVAYNGQLQKVFGGTFVGVLDDDDLVRDASTMPYVCEGTDVGEYDGHLTSQMTVQVVVIKAHGDAKVDDNVTDCYDISLVTGKLVITKASAADNPVTAAAYSGTYDKQAHTIAAPSAKTGSAFFYSTVNPGGTAEVNWTDTAPEFTDAGTYTVYIKATNDNYEDSFGSSTVTIAPAPITVTADNQTKAAGSTDPEYTFSVDGLMNGDTKALIACNFSRVAGEKPGTYAITPFGDKVQGNYSITYKPGTLTIASGVINAVTAISYSGAYDGQPHTIAASASQAGSTLYYSKIGGANASDWSTTAPTLTGTGTMTVYVKAENANYDDAFGSATITITPAPITITAASDSKVYDGTALVNSKYSISGSFASGEGLASVTVTGSQTHAGSSSNAVSGYTLQDGTSASNYSITTAAGTLAVSKATDNTVVVSGYSGTYDGAAHGITATPKILTGTTLSYSTDNAIWSETMPTLTNVGTETVYVKAANPDCEDATASVVASATITITAAPLTVTAGSKAFVYDGSAHTDPSWSITSGKLFGTDAISVAVSGSIKEVIESPVANTVSDVTFTSGAVSNYSITKANGTLTMMASSANSVTVTPYSGTYDGKAHTVTATPSQDGATIRYSKTDPKDGAVSVDWQDDAPTLTDVGTMTVYVKASAGNYNDAYGSATVTISQAPLTITANDKTKYFGADDPIFDATATGLVNGETIQALGEAHKLSYSIGHDSSNNVGTHVLTISGDASQGNYSITYVNGTLTIVKAPASHNPVTATGWSGLYDGSSHNITASAYWTNLTTFKYSTDNVNWVDTLALRNAGTYTVYVEALNPSFETSYGQAAVTISKRSLVLTGESGSETYTGSAIELVGIDQTGDGLVANQTLSGISYSAKGTDAGSYTGAFTGNAVIQDALLNDMTSNYSISTVPGTLTIAKLPASDNAVTATSYSSAYDGASHTISASAAQSGSTLYYSTDQATWTTAAPAWSDVTDGAQTVYVKAVNPKYEDSSANATVTITPAPATVAAVDASKVYGEADPALSATVSGTFGSDTIDYTVSRAAGEEVGVDYAITATGKANQGNYTVSYTSATFTIDPVPAVPDIAIEPQTYTGKPISLLEKDVTITYSDGTKKTTLVYGTDYEISDYTENIDAGTATCTIMLKGNYSGTTMTHFIINPAQVKVPDSTLAYTYDGTAKTCVTESTDGSYDVTGTNTATNAGSYSATAVLKDAKNTVWSDGSAADKPYSWSIAPAAVTVAAQNASKVCGAADPTLSAKVTGLVNGESESLISYTVSRATGETAGTYAITASGKAVQGNYSVTYVPAKFTIKAIDASAAKVDPVPSQVHTGSAIEPPLNVTLEGRVLYEGIDYNVTYADNVDAGTASYQVDFIGNYYSAMPLVGTFVIAAQDASDATVDPVDDQSYTGDEIKPALTVRLGTGASAKTLVLGTDYNVAYSHNVNVGEADYTITFSEFYGSIVKRGSFKITPMLVQAPTYKPSLDYTGAEQASVSATEADHYAVTGGSATDAGSYTATVSLKDKANMTWADGTVDDLTYAWKIVPADASSATVSGIEPAYTYTGSAITPAPTVKLALAGSEKTLVAGTDYDVTYTDNTDTGEASYKITFKGNYTSVKPLTGTFAITAQRDAKLVDDTGSGITQTGLGDVLAKQAALAPNAESIIIDLDVKQADATGSPALSIKALASASGLIFDKFYDVQLTKTVDGTTTDIGSANDVLIGITYPFDFTGKDIVRVFAYHAGTAYELTETADADGEYIALDRSVGTVTVYAKRYSTFGIGYTTVASTETSSNTISAAGSTGGSVGSSSIRASLAKTGDAAVPLTILCLFMMMAAGALLVVSGRKEAKAAVRHKKDKTR